MPLEREKIVCTACEGSGRVVDTSQAGEPVATCMTCRGNGWVWSDQLPAQVNAGWLRGQTSPEETR